MELEFWQSRWDSGEIGFHEGAPNALLVKYARFFARPGRVLVPLCGKAADLAFLASLGHSVVGVEVVRQPCVDFFAERGLARTEERRGPFAVHRAGAIEIWQGDVFAATPDLLGVFDGAWDRAALVALAPMTRAKYVDVLRRLVPVKGRVLLDALLYDQSKTPGPPWSIDRQVVRSLFRRHFVIEPLETVKAAPPKRLQEAGVTTLEEHITLLTRI